MYSNIRMRDFAVKVKAAIQDILGDEYVVNTSENFKMNGVKKWAVTIHRSVNIAPTIYLDTFYDSFVNGTDFDIIIETIIDIYRSSAPTEDVDMSSFLDFDLIKDRICFKLCNTVKNDKILAAIPSLPFFDLSIVFYVLVNNDTFGSGQILVRNEHLDMWNVGVTELMACAKKNTPRLLNIRMSNIIDVMQDIMQRNFENGECEYLPDITQIDRDECFMWVISNDEGYNGAASILYPNAFDDIYEVIGDSFFVIPCSIHEVIVVPDKEGTEGDDNWENRCSELLDMVHQVNSTDVPETDILSDSLYYYNADDKVFRLVCTKIIA